jgi:CRISPR-associated protein Csm2
MAVQPPRSGFGGQRPPFSGGQSSSGQGFGGSKPQGSTAPPLKNLPTPRPVAYFRDGKLIPELMDSEAERIARELGQVSTTQLRRFYEDVLNLRQRLAAAVGRQDNAEEVFSRLRADFKMLKAKAVYANGRSGKAFPRELLQFFIDHVEAVKNARDFEAFCKHFQAVVAFHKFYGKD